MYTAATPPTDRPQIVLASGSAYRLEALQRLGLDAVQIPPEVDETPLSHETPAALAGRLSLAKARAVQDRAGPEAVIIGGDQVGELHGAPIGKPGSAAAARAQLAAASGQTLVFHSGLVVLRGEAALCSMTTTTVVMRNLDAAAIARYVERDQPLDCAGSFKCESLGIALFRECSSTDPTALYGLPLIALVSALSQLGIDCL